MSRHHRRKHRFKIRSLYVWHRYLGVTAALFVLVLAVTGLALNHTGTFQWDSRHVQSDWLLDWYGIDAPEHGPGYQAGDHIITLYGERLYLDSTAVEGHYRELIGAIALPDMVAAAVDQQILLLTPEGEIIERLGGKEGVPAGMHGIGLSERGRLLIQGGHAIYHPDADFLRWKHWEGRPDTAQWVKPIPLTDTLKTVLATDFRSSVLPLERVLLDLHSGRIFGTYGIYIMDGAAVIMILLAISGFIMWARRRR